MYKTFIIIPVKDLMQAPGIAVTVKDGKNAYIDARYEAMQRSRLSEFDGWTFW